MPNDKPQPLTPEEVAAQQAKLPVWLQLSPAQREEDKALQIQLATAGPMAHLNAEERQLMRAAALQHHARTQLAAADEETNPDEIDQAKRTLAEGLAMAGDFREAADLHPDEHQSAKFAQIADAVERDDSEVCECVPVEHELEGKKITIHPRIISEHVFSKRHGKLMPVIKCVECGDLNVRAAGTATATRQAAVAQARAEVRR